MYQIVLTQSVPHSQVLYRVFALALPEALEVAQEIQDANPECRVRVLQVPTKNQ